jgi:hypothetical protein
MPKRFGGMPASAAHILKEEGPVVLTSRALSWLLRHAFQYRHYYVAIVTKSEEDEADFAPRIKDFSVKVVATPAEIDNLQTEGFSLGAHEASVRRFVDCGAHVWCVFVGTELAHINCMAFDERGKRVIDPVPFRVEFRNGEICGGTAVTVPKFRRLHIRTYIGYLRRQWAWEHGFLAMKNSFDTTNIAALAEASRYRSQIVSECRYVKFLWIRHVSETKVGPIDAKALLERRAKLL